MTNDPKAVFAEALAICVWRLLDTPSDAPEHYTVRAHSRRMLESYVTGDTSCLSTEVDTEFVLANVLQAADIKETR